MIVAILTPDTLHERCGSILTSTCYSMIAYSVSSTSLLNGHKTLRRGHNFKLSWVRCVGVGVVFGAGRILVIIQ